MTMRERLRGAAVGALLERPAKRQGLARQVQGLQEAGKKLSARLGGAAGTPQEQEVLRHIIGLERWGGRRLRLATEFGDAGSGVRDLQAVFSDTHHAYKPLETASWVELQEKFAATRRETVELAQRLMAKPEAAEVRVPHNDLGELTVGAWLRYLQLHASFEGRKIRPTKG